MKPNGNTILITGGGSGIGLALADRLHALGNRIILAGRRLDVLEQAAAGRPGMATMQMDLSDASGTDQSAQAIIAAHPELNILINNAGILRYEVLDRHRDLSDAEETITTNLLGPIRLTNALIAHLAEQADAAVINVTSGLAFVPMAAAPTYCATKAAMHSYTLSLRQSLKGRIEVIEIAPPAVQTQLTPGQETRSGYQPLAEFADEVMALLSQQPTPAEILVKQVQPLRHAEAEGHFEEKLALLNMPH